jgi:hypothetical protein
MAIQDIANRAERLGIDSNNTSSSPLSEDQQIRNYISKKYVRFDAADIANNKNSNESSELSS